MAKAMMKYLLKIINRFLKPWRFARRLDEWLDVQERPLRLSVALQELSRTSFPGNTVYQPMAMASNNAGPAKAGKEGCFYGYPFSKSVIGNKYPDRAAFSIVSRPEPASQAPGI